jgi:hypothetical protein
MGYGYSRGIDQPDIPKFMLTESYLCIKPDDVPQYTDCNTITRG